MSTTIDQRVVEMRFDNKQFESGVSTTLSSINKLKESLKFRDSTKGLEDVSAAAKRVDMSSLGGAVEKVGLKFNALYTVADQALRNITNSAMNAGKRIVSALTIDPIKTGFQEYETQINAIQTILANTESKGTTLDDVNKALGELNTYADKTIYNFTEMTRNIGTFTAAGVDLDTSVSAIKGIANLAAVSGSTSQQASTAMYQLSQALASGTVKLMDWNSVVNAGMGGQVFQDALKETARVHGIAIDDLIEKEGSFRETLSSGWLSSEILTETLAKFTGDLSEAQLKSMGYTDEQVKSIIKMGQTANDAATKVKTFTQLFDTLKEAAQSGWTQTWEILVGDFEEAKELLTTISDALGGMIGKSSDARNELLGMWKSLGGRKDLLDSFFNIFMAITSIIQPIKQAFNEIFPPLTVERLLAFTSGLKDFTSRMVLSAKASDNLKRTFKGIFAVIKLAGKIFGAAVKAVGSLFGVVGDLGGGVLGVTACLGDFLVKISELIGSGNLFTTVFQGVANVIKFVVKLATTFLNFLTTKLVFPGLEALVNGFASLGDKMAWLPKVAKKVKASISSAFSGFGEGSKSGASSAIDAMREKFGQLKDSASDTKDSIASSFKSMGASLKDSALFKILQSLWKTAKTVGKAIADSIKGILGSIVDKAKSGDVVGIIDIINGVIQGGLGLGLIKFIKSLTDAIKGVSDPKGGIVASIKNVVDSVGGCFDALSERINPKETVNIMDIAKAIAVLTAAIVILSLVDKDKVADSLGAITALIIELVGSVAIISKMTQTTQMAKIGKDVYTMGSDMGLLIKALVPIATAVLILSFALSKIGKLSMAEVSKGLLGVSALMVLLPGVLVLFRLIAKIGSKSDKLDVDGAIKSMIKRLGPIILAVAALSLVVKSLGKLSMAEVSKGLLGVSALMVMIAGIMALLELIAKIEPEDQKSFTKMVGKMGAIVLVIRSLSNVLKSLSKLSMKDLSKGMLGIGFLMVTITGMMALLALISKIKPPSEKDVKDFSTERTVAMLLAIGVTAKIMASTLTKIAKLNWEELKRGLVGMAATMSLLAGTMAAISLVNKKIPTKDLMSSAKSLVIMASSLIVMGLALKLFANIEWESLGKAASTLYGLVGALALVALIGKIIKPGPLAAASASLVILSVALSSLVPTLLLFTLINWTSIGKAGVALAGLVGAVALIALIGKIINPGLLVAATASLVVAAIALQVVAGALLKLLPSLVLLSAMKVGTLAKTAVGLLAVLTAIGLGLTFMVTALPGALALGVVSAALLAFIPSLVLISTISGGTLAKAAFSLLGIMTALAVGLTLMIAALPGAIALYAVAGALVMLAAGITAFGAGFTVFMSGLAGGVVAFLSVLIVGILNIIPAVVKVIGTLISEILKVIIVNAPLIAETVLALCLAVANILTESAPVLVDAIVKFLLRTLEILVEYIGPIIDVIANLIVKILDSLIKHIPVFVQKLVELFIAVGKGLIDALTQMDTETLVKGVLGIGLITVLILACSSLAGLIPGAMLGLLGLAAFVVELGLVLAAIGAIAQIPGLQWLIDEGGDFLQSIGTAIGKFVGGIMGGIAEGATSTLPQVGTNLSNFMTNIKPFIEGANLIKPETMEGVNTLANVILKLTAANLIDGLTKWLTGGNSLVRFGMELAAFAPFFKSYANTVSGITTETVVASANAALSLAEMANKLPKRGGLVSLITGENSIVAFGAELALFAPLFKKYATTVDGITVDTVVASANAALSLAEMASKLPKQGGLVSLVTGENSIVAFGAELVAFAPLFKAYANSIKDVEPAVIEASSTSALTIAEMANKLPKTGGLVSLITGDNSLAKFGAELALFGPLFYLYAKSIKNVKPDVVTASAAAATSLAEMANKLPKQGFWDKLFGNETEMETFGACLADFGKAMGKYAKAVDGVTPSKLNSATEAAVKLADLAKGIEGTDFTGLSKFGEALGKVGSDGIDKFVEAFSNGKDRVSKAGSEMITHFIEGCQASASKLMIAMVQVVNAAIIGIKIYRQSFYNAGVYICEGLKDGIDDSSWSITSKVKAVMKAALDAAKKALGINSPSKEFYKIGEFSGQGFVNALDDYGTTLYKAGSGMAESARDGLRYAMNKLNEVISNDISTQPTIRPVLDLSNVRSGASAIGNLLDNTSSVGVLAKVGSINAAMSKHNQNGDPLASAIDALRKDLKNSDRATYNINGITYDDGSNIVEAVQTLIRAAKVERRV